MSLVALGTAWAAPETLPAAAVPGHYVTQDQFGLVLVIGAVLALVPLVDAVMRWTGLQSKRVLAPQPLEVKATPQYMERGEYERIAAACVAERRQMIETAKADREAIQRQIDHLANAIRVELKQHNDAASTRADVLHGRITSLVEPLGAVRQRLDDHIHDARAHTPNGDPT